MKKISIVILMILMVAGCGRRGALVPPEALVPASIADLRVEQKGESFLVSWSKPLRDEGGRGLEGLAAFELFRREILPLGEDCEECSSAYRLLAKVDLEYPQGVISRDNRFFFFDYDLAVGKSYRYKIISLKRAGGQSRDSNRADRKKLSPPVPPVVKGVSMPSGVTLAWEPVAAPPNGRIVGYNVYRKAGNQKDSPVPLNSSPVAAAPFEDGRLEPGVKYGYTVRTVAVIEGETVESEPSVEVEGALGEPE